MKNGKKLSKKIPTAKGVPPLYLTTEEVEKKFKNSANFGKLLSKTEIDRTSKSILSLEKVGKMSGIMSTLA